LLDKMPKNVEEFKKMSLEEGAPATEEDIA
jgi:hypothetical protein